jgi:hypothetical protein
LRLVKQGVLRRVTCQKEAETDDSEPVLGWEGWAALAVLGWVEPLGWARRVLGWEHPA